APKQWMLDKLRGRWAPKPNAGPHKLRECLPLIVMLRQRLKRELNLLGGGLKRKRVLPRDDLVHPGAPFTHRAELVEMEIRRRAGRGPRISTCPVPDSRNEKEVPQPAPEKLHGQPRGGVQKSAAWEAATMMALGAQTAKVVIRSSGGLLQTCKTSGGGAFSHVPRWKDSDGRRDLSETLRYRSRCSMEIQGIP
ncbi:unnamed protein product, partial [Durusdinium trenchii]